MTADETSLLEFPCRFPIKAMGLNAGDFREKVVAIVRRHVSGEAIAEVHCRESRGGRWLAVTVTVIAESRAQLDDIYRDLSGDEHVVFAL